MTRPSLFPVVFVLVLVALTVFFLQVDPGQLKPSAVARPARLSVEESLREPAVDQLPSAVLPPSLFVPGIVLVKFAEDVSEQRQSLLLSRAGAEIMHELRGIGVLVLRVKEGQEQDVALQLGAAEEVEFAQLDYLRPALQAQPGPPEQLPLPNDPLYGQQWHVPKIKAEVAWNIEKGEPSTVIAIIDSDINWTHEDLQGNMWQNPGEIPGNNIDDDGNGYKDDIVGWDFVDSGTACASGEDCSTPDNNPHGKGNHGTHVAGLAAAVTNNAKGGVGVCQRCKIMGLRAGYVQGGGAIVMRDSNVVSALVYAADEDADVIVMAFGGPAPSPVLESAVQYASAQGMVMIASAGISGASDSVYPAALEQVLGVAATDANDQRALFSSYSRYGRNGTVIDVAAPGTNVWSTAVKGSPYGCSDFDGNGYSMCSGTSMSAGIVGGVVGLLRSKNPALSAEQVATIIRSADDPLSSANAYIAQRTNAYKVLTYPTGIAVLYHPGFMYGQGVVPLTGTATAPGFQQYKVEIGAGVYPSAWTLIGSGNSPILQGTLATLNPTALGLSIGTYTLRLTVTAQQKTLEDVALVHIDPNLVAGWPKSLGLLSCLTGGFDESRPALVDVDNNNNRELFMAARTDDPNSFSCFIELQGRGQDGGSLPGFPIIVSHISTNTVSTVAVADLDADGMSEIAFHTYCQSCPSGTFSRFYLYQEDGTLKFGWPIDLPTTPDFPYPINPNNPVIANVDGGNDLEMIFVTTSGSATLCDNDPGNKIYVYKHTGQLVPGWPKQLPCLAYNSPAVGDIDNNGDMEIVIAMQPPNSGTIGNVYVYNHDGSIFPGWPKAINEVIPVALADVDMNDNGKLEIISVRRDLSTYQPWVHVVNHDGTPASGWPVQLPTAQFYSGLLDEAIGDIDNNDNGKPEILARTGEYLYLLNHDGTIVNGWPVAIPTNTRPYHALVVDLEGDGPKEILIDNWQSSQATPPMPLWAFRADGTVVPGFPKMVEKWFKALAAGDLNGNNKVDVLVVDYDGLMYLWEFTGAPTAMNLPWPDFRHDVQRTSKL